MRRRLRILALTAAAEAAALVVGFVIVDRRVSRQSDLIDEALAKRPGATIDELMMHVAAGRGAR